MDREIETQIVPMLATCRGANQAEATKGATKEPTKETASVRRFGTSLSSIIFRLEKRERQRERKKKKRKRKTRPDTRHKIRLVCVLSTFENNTGRTYGPTDGRTDRRTDTTSYRDATAHLKMRLRYSNNGGEHITVTSNETEFPI